MKKITYLFTFIALLLIGNASAQVQDFDHLKPGVHPFGWTAFAENITDGEVGEDGGWTITDEYVSSGYNIKMYKFDTKSDCWLVTRQTTPTAGNTDLTFKAATYGGDFGSKLEIYVSTEGTQPTSSAGFEADPVKVVTEAEVGEGADGHTEVTVDLSAYEGQAIYIGFKVHNWGSPGTFEGGDNWWLDDITLFEEMPLSLGDGGKYATFTDAINYINGLTAIPDGGLEFKVVAGTQFDENPPAITASGTSDNPVKFVKCGEGDNPVIMPTGAGDTEYAIRINGGDYFTFDGIDVSANETTDGAVEYGFYITNTEGSSSNGAMYNTIKNCTVALNTQDGASVGIRQSVIDNLTSYDGANSYNKYQNITVKNAFKGIKLDGNYYGNAEYEDQECEISGCTITDIGGSGRPMGIELVSQENAKVFNNEIMNMTSDYRIIGLYLEERTLGVEVYDNLFHDFTNDGANYLVGIRGWEPVGCSIHNNKFYNMHCTDNGWTSAIEIRSGTDMMYYNNMIWDISAPNGSSTGYPSTVGIGLLWQLGTAKVYNNTIYIDDVPADGTDNISTGLWIRESNNCDLKNNIIVNKTDVSNNFMATGIFFQVTADIATIDATSDNNVYYSGTPDEKHLIAYDAESGNKYQMLDDYKTLASSTIVGGVEQNSLTEDVSEAFVSETDLHIRTDVRTAIADAGIPLAEVTTDFDGDARDAETPDIGADEGDFFPPAPDPVTINPVFELNDNNKNLPDWWNPGYFHRGIAIGNGHIYLVGAEDYNTYKTEVRVLDAKTGNDIDGGKFLSLEGVTNNGFHKLYDIAVDDDGVIVAANKTHNKWHPFKVYKWDTEESDPEVLINFSNNPEGYRLSDKFTVVGSVNGNGAIYAAISGTNKVLYWAITDGVPVETPETVEISDIETFGNIAGVDVFGENMIVNGFQVQPTLVNMNGEMIGEFELGTGNSVIKTVSCQSQTLAATLSWAGSSKIIDLSDGADVSFLFASTESMGTIANVEGSGDIDFTTENGILRMAVLGTNNGLAMYQLNPDAPANPVVDDENNTFGWDYVAGYANADDYEYSIDGGATWTACTANPQPIANVTLPAGMVKVRVAEDAVTGFAGGPLASDERFLQNADPGAPLTRGWEYSAASNTLPDYFGAHTERGIAYGNDHVYVASRSGGNHVYMLNAATGEVEGELNTSGIDVGLYKINDMEVSDDGQILVCNLTLHSAGADAGWGGGPFVITKWSDENAEPEEFINYISDGDVDLRLGDKITVVGDISGDAAIYAAGSASNKVVRWIVTGGVLGDPTVIELQDVSSLGTSPTVAPLGVDADADFYVNGSSVTPMLYAADGTFKGAIPGEVVSSSGNSVKAFQYDGKQLLATYQFNNANAVILDVTNGVGTDFSADDIYQTLPSLGSASNPNGTGDVAYRLGDEGSLIVFQQATNNGIAAWTTDDVIPMATQVKVDGLAKVGLEMQASYTYADINGDAEGASMYKWYRADAADGTYTVITDATQAVYTCQEADALKYLKFEVIPVSATGTSTEGDAKMSMAYGPVAPADAEFPVATNVNVTGVLETLEVLTGNYTYEDANNDDEGASIYTWYRADDALGTNATVISGANTTTYEVTNEDIGKFIAFEVTPVAADGILLEGETVTSAYVGPIEAKPFPPEAKNVAISGVPEPGNQLTGSYDYYDANDDAEAGTTFRWLLFESTAAYPTNGTAVDGAVDVTFNVTSDMVDKYVAFEVTPRTMATPSVGTPALSEAVLISTYIPVAPVAENLSVRGVLEVGVVLEGEYDFSDYNDEPEGESLYQWFELESTSSNPTTATEIAGATNVTYAPTKDQLGKALMFKVTPVEASDANLAGEPVTTVVGPISASSQIMPLERLWVRQEAYQSTPSWFSAGGNTERGMAYGNGYVYVASRNGGANPRVIDAETGADVGLLSTMLNGTDPIGNIGYFHLSDMATSEDGSVLGCNMTLNATSNAFRVYKWDSHDADPTLYIEYTSDEDMRLGDEFSVYGDLSGEAYIFAVPNGGGKIIKWTVTGGTLNATPEIIDLVGVDNVGTNASVILTEVSADADFWVNGAGFAPTLFDKDGNTIGSLPGGVISTGTNAAKHIKLADKEYFLAFEYGTSEVVVIDVTSDVMTDAKLVAKTNTFGEISNGNGSGDVGYKIENDELYIYGLLTNNGVGAYKLHDLEAAKPVAENLTVQGIAEEGVVLEATYDYSDGGVGVEGASTIQWYHADDDQGTNAVAIDGATATTYLLGEADMNKYLMFEVTPVAEGGLMVGDAAMSAAVGAVVESPDTISNIKRLWARTAETNSVPQLFGSQTERSVAAGNGHVYIPSRNIGAVAVLDQANGFMIGKLDMTGISSENCVFSISGAEVDDAGNILVCNLAIGVEKTFRVYRWADEESAPELLIEYNTVADRRLGDNFTVIGDVDANAAVYAVDKNTNQVLRWIITDGAIPAEPEVITLAGYSDDDPWGINPAAAPLGPLASDKFYIGSWTQSPTLFNTDGTAVDTVNIVSTGTGLNYFEINDRAYTINHQRTKSNHYNAVICDVTDGPADAFLHAESEVNGAVSASSQAGDNDIIIDGGDLYVVTLTPNNGLQFYQVLLGIPTNFVSAMTDPVGQTIEVTFDKVMAEPTTGAETEFTVNVDGTEVDVTTVALSSEDNKTIVLTLATAIADGTSTVTVSYSGTILQAADGTGVASFTDESVTNFAGAAAPEAQNVAISGEANQDEVLTADYTYFDANDDPEGDTEFVWYRADDDQGTNQEIIIGANSDTYTVDAADAGKYIAVEVTPVATEGGEDFLVGDAVMSDWVQVTTGIEDVFAANMKLYPNPVNDILYVVNASQVDRVVIHNIVGQEVSRFENLNGSQELRINTANLQQGVYIVTFFGEKGQTRTEKVIKR